MNEIIPIFYDQSSFKSILTFEKPKKCKEYGPASIVKICQDNGLKKCVVFSKNFSTFVDGWKNLKEIGVDLIWGIEFIICDDTNDKTDESRNNEHKIVVMMKNKDGYNDLLKIYSECHSNPDNKYYVQRFDLKKLKKLWTDNLILVLPFFDSFIAKNLLSFGASIVPDFSFTKPVIFKEVGSQIPFDAFINKALDKYNKDGKLIEVKTKTIYYEKRDDFRAYSVYRAIMNKEHHTKPNLEHFSSKEFCFESYFELIKDGS